MKQKTFVEKTETASRNWRVVDADGKVLGRLASKVAVVLRGKDKPTFTPHIDCGDFVVVINADKVKVTGNKLEGKKYAYYTGYRGGLKTSTAGQLLDKKPEEMIRLAVYGMLPHGPLGQRIITKLKVYKGTAHPHTAQKPVALSV